jgi:hypothetical protein
MQCLFLGRPMPNPSNPRAARHRLRILAMPLLLVLVACTPSPPPPAASGGADGPRERHFTGSWSITGNRQTLKMGPDHRAEIFRLGGSLMLAGDSRPGLAFRSDIIGLRDNQSGMQARSVWTDERGDQVFSELRGGAGGPGQLIEGRFVGLAIGIWFAPIPEGLTREAWHLFAIFAAAIFAVIVNAYAAADLGTAGRCCRSAQRNARPGQGLRRLCQPQRAPGRGCLPGRAGGGQVRPGQRISLRVVTVFGKSTLGLAYSIFITDALIAPGFPSNTARGGVLYPIILALPRAAARCPRTRASAAWAAT